MLSTPHLCSHPPHQPGQSPGGRCRPGAPPRHSAPAAAQHGTAHIAHQHNYQQVAAHHIRRQQHNKAALHSTEQQCTHCHINRSLHRASAGGNSTAKFPAMRSTSPHQEAAVKLGPSKKRLLSNCPRNLPPEYLLLLKKHLQLQPAKTRHGLMRTTTAPTSYASFSRMQRLWPLSPR